MINSLIFFFPFAHMDTYKYRVYIYIEEYVIICVIVVYARCVCPLIRTTKIVIHVLILYDHLIFVLTLNNNDICLILFSFLLLFFFCWSTAIWPQSDFQLNFDNSYWIERDFAEWSCVITCYDTSARVCSELTAQSHLHQSLLIKLILFIDFAGYRLVAMRSKAFYILVGIALEKLACNRKILKAKIEQSMPLALFLRPVTGYNVVQHKSTRAQEHKLAEELAKRKCIWHKYCVCSDRYMRFSEACYCYLSSSSSSSSIQTADKQAKQNTIDCLPFC